jgi:hypothetical protein
LVTTPIPLEARLDVLPVRGGEGFLRAVFEPLGYEVGAVRHPLDERFPEWGESPYFSVTIRRTVTLSELLSHLYVLVPVFDAKKHYFVGHDEMEKLLAKGEGWLARHPANVYILSYMLESVSWLKPCSKSASARSASPSWSTGRPTPRTCSSGSNC